MKFMQLPMHQADFLNSHDVTEFFHKKLRDN